MVTRVSEGKLAIEKAWGDTGNWWGFYGILRRTMMGTLGSISPPGPSENDVRERSLTVGLCRQGEMIWRAMLIHTLSAPSMNRNSPQVLKRGRGQN